jgi:benzoylformate decarboxylase
MRTTGIHAFIEMLHAAGVRYIFGNPGTTELPLNDALVEDRRIQYILGLQEVPVMAMADGYAMASGGIGVVNLHISCGLGNAMGMLYNAHREGTPLLVTAGQQDRRLKFEEPILTSDMVSVARPWTKWSAEVERVEDLPSALRRAVQTALTPPTGPVFLSIPIDVQRETGELDVTMPERLDVRTRPPVEALRRAAELLASAKNPGILAGSRVVERDAVRELVALAEQLGAPAISESGTTHGRLGFPADHPLYGQCLPLWSPEVRERLDEFDVLLVCGMDLLRLYVYHEPARAIPEHVKIVHLDEDAWEIGKNYPVDVGLLGNTKAGLAELGELLAKTMMPTQVSLAKERRAVREARHREQREKLQAEFAAQVAARPLTPLGMMGSIARVLPKDVAVIEEAVTTTNTYLERLGAHQNTSGYFAHRGWALGWGLGCTLGVKLAWPDRPVLGILGEGAAMYGIQGLWSAAHHGIPVTFVIANNAQYQILKVGAQGLQLPQALRGKFESLELVQPEIDIVGLARAFGVDAQRINDPDELSDVLAAGWKSDRPRLIDVPITRTTPGRMEY